MKELHVPGVSITMIANRNLAWSRSFGLRSSNESESVDKSTVMEACSMSKPLFAYAVLKLVEEGTLDLDRPLVEYLSKPYLEDEPLHLKMTARMVMSHTGGFPNWREGGWRKGGPLPVKFEPGTQFSYSGEGFLFLQRVVEELTHEDLDRWMNEKVIRPLGMKRSRYVWNKKFQKNFAAGHRADGSLKRNRSFYDRANAAFSLYTTASDYALFLVEMLKIDRTATHSLQASTLESMLAKQSYSQTRDLHWGLGWAIKETDRGVRISHGGSNGTGFRCWCEFYPATGEGIVIMTNSVSGYELYKQLVSELNALDEVKSD